jgi:hypothetical protein
MITPDDPDAFSDIDCKDCGVTFSEPEHSIEFFLERGWAPPTRCNPCRRARKVRMVALEKARARYQSVEEGR